MANQFQFLFLIQKYDCVVVFDLSILVALLPISVSKIYIISKVSVTQNKVISKNYIGKLAITMW